MLSSKLYIQDCLCISYGVLANLSLVTCWPIFGHLDILSGQSKGSKPLACLICNFIVLVHVSCTVLPKSWILSKLLGF